MDISLRKKVQSQYKKKQKIVEVLYFKNESVITNLSTKIGKKKTTAKVLEKNSRDLKKKECIATHYF